MLAFYAFNRCSGNISHGIYTQKEKHMTLNGFPADSYPSTRQPFLHLTITASPLGHKCSSHKWGEWQDMAMPASDERRLHKN